MTDAAPIVVTLQFDAAATEMFERRRRRYFPPEINRIPAHLTLFHALPGEEEAAVLEAVGRAAGRPPFAVKVEGLMPLGRGIAFRLSSPALMTLRADLARSFEHWLTRQDRESFRPHVTIQNKVSAEVARATQAELERTFTPFEAIAEGIQLWHYRGGPWSPLAAVAFGGGR